MSELRNLGLRELLRRRRVEVRLDTSRHVRIALELPALRRGDRPVIVASWAGRAAGELATLRLGRSALRRVVRRVVAGRVRLAVGVTAGARQAARRYLTLR